MELFRLHAYSVSPQRKAEESIEPVGGPIRATNELAGLLGQNEIEASLSDKPLVDFVMDGQDRRNEVRESLMTFVFGDSKDAKIAGASLASRLASSMDGRSAASLLVVTAYKQEGGSGRVILWVFPRDQALRLSVGKEGPSIDVLTDVFSQTSRLRKAAMFQGKNVASGFIQGHVLDVQANSTTREVADFWIARFLLCSLAMKGETATRMLAKIVRKVHETRTAPDEREQLQAAVAAIRHSPHKRTTLKRFADTYLTNEVRRTFLDALPNDYTATSSFDFDRHVFDAVLQFRVFQLDTGVFVSSPLSQVGESVRITDGTKRTLKCEGTVLDERLKTRHG